MFHSQGPHPSSPTRAAGPRAASFRVMHHLEGKLSRLELQASFLLHRPGLIRFHLEMSSVPSSSLFFLASDLNTWFVLLPPTTGGTLPRVPVFVSVPRNAHRRETSLGCCHSLPSTDRCRQHLNRTCLCSSPINSVAQHHRHTDSAAPQSTMISSLSDVFRSFSSAYQ